MLNLKNIAVKIFKIITYVLFISLKIFIKEKYIIISGHNAKHLTGNNQYFFNFLNNQEPSFKYFFYTKDKNEYKKLIKKYPGKILYAYSLKTFIAILKAKILIISTGPDDFMPYPLLESKIIINLWHGTPIKKIGFCNTPNNKNAKILSKAIDYFCVSSEFESNIMQRAFNLKKENIFISGLPKNDFINKSNFSIIEKLPILKNKKIILYAPTFRDDNKTINITDILPLNEINDLLIKYDAYFLYRLHINSEEQEKINEYDRIISASSKEFPDPQELLYYTDILITDYSGIFFDFLLLNRPIIFYNYDFDKYDSIRGFTINYEENTPGPKVRNKNELLNKIKLYINNPEIDEKERLLMQQKFHKYTDGKASKRIFELINKLYNGDSSQARI